MHQSLDLDLHKENSISIDKKNKKKQLNLCTDSDDLFDIFFHRETDRIAELSKMSKNGMKIVNLVRNSKNELNNDLNYRIAYDSLLSHYFVVLDMLLRYNCISNLKKKLKIKLLFYKMKCEQTTISTIRHKRENIHHNDNHRSTLINNHKEKHANAIKTNQKTTSLKRKLNTCKSTLESIRKQIESKYRFDLFKVIYHEYRKRTKHSIMNERELYDDQKITFDLFCMLMYSVISSRYIIYDRETSKFRYSFKGVNYECSLDELIIDFHCFEISFQKKKYSLIKIFRQQFILFEDQLLEKTIKSISNKSLSDLSFSSLKSDITLLVSTINNEKDTSHKSYKRFVLFFKVIFFILIFLNMTLNCFIIYFRINK